MRSSPHFLLFFLLIIPIISFGQSRKRYVFDHLSKGKTVIGVSASGNWFRKEDIGTFNLKAGHFFMNQLNTGLTGEYKTTGTLKTQKLGGVYARYYFINKRFSTFGEANYLMGKSEVKGDSLSFSTAQIGGAIGLAYTGILDHFGVEVFEELVNEMISGKSQLYFLLSVRVNFFF